jgi:hypothetical protein
VLAIPTVAAAIVVGERSLQTFQAHVRAAQNGLAHVVEAVDHVPVVIFRHGCDVPEGVVGGHGGVNFHDSEQAVQLVGHGCREHSLVGPNNGRRQVVVILWIGNGLKSHALCGNGQRRNKSFITSLLTGHEPVPGLQSLRGEELRSVHGREGLINVELSDLGRNCPALMPNQLLRNEPPTVSSPSRDVASDFRCTAAPLAAHANLSQQPLIFR